MTCVTNSLLTMFICLPAIARGQEWNVRIWENTSVHNKSVTLVPYIPEDSSHTHVAIIVCPGGSYCWHDYDVEGVRVAEWLRNQGIAAFVLKYRVQGIVPYITHSRAIFGGHKHPDMMEDIQRSIQLVRENTSLHGIPVKHVGVMGFSAGGHLAMSAACYASTDFLVPLGIQHSVSLRPDFVAPIYPVVSMSHPDTHKRSRRALLGEWGKHRKHLRDSLSLEKHIPADCPPVFLVNCVDDPIVKSHNSELLDSALTARGINYQYIQYQTGGHGFGASETRGTAECRTWRERFIEWLKGMNLD